MVLETLIKIIMYTTLHGKGETYRRPHYIRICNVPPVWLQRVSRDKRHEKQQQRYNLRTIQMVLGQA
jgi:hypothetical protein